MFPNTTDLPKDNRFVSSLQPRARRLSLRVDHKAGVIRLTIPPRTPQSSIQRFINANNQWIEEKSKTLHPKVVIENHAIIPFCGHDHEICIHPHTKRTTDIFAEGGKIHVSTSRDDPTTNLKRWLIEEARLAIEPLSTAKASEIGKKITKIDLRDTSTRWGSCSTDKRLMFSWRLIMAPDYVLDYVIGHEVAHLKHMDHSKKFWDVCYALSDQPDEARQWLKDHGNTLMRYF